MRALLVVNPQATTTSPRTRDVLARALRSEVELSVAQTTRRGHAAELAAQAAHDGVDVVVSLGGDGTINEIVNGLMGLTPGTPVPVLGVVPGGSTNVFARALGLPRDPVDATGALLEALHEGRFRTVGLGQVDDRWFTFCAGFGLDAEVIRRVERARRHGKTATPGLYVRSALAQYTVGTDRSAPLITLKRPDADTEEVLSMAIVQNTAPWTYIGGRAIDPQPEASFETGLDLLGLRGLGLFATVRAAGQLLATGGMRGRGVFRLHDLDEFTLTAPRPLAYQVDGDYLGERDTLTFRTAPHALRVLA